MKEESKLAARPYFHEDDLPRITRDIERVLRSGRLIFGEETEALEAEFADYVGVRHAVAVSSCSAALEIALTVLGARGCQVVVPTNTFVATANAAVRVGGELVLCECDEDGNTGVEDALASVTDRTAAVVVVHVAGFVSRDFARLVAECRRLGVALVEDCAHAHGATYYTRQVGSIGDAGCFSFYPTKIMTCGVGGMLTTNRDDVAAAARSLRHHGQGASLEEIVAVGSDWLMDEVRAVLARAQLRRLDDVLHKRRLLALHYRARLRDADAGIAPPEECKGSLAAYYKFPVTLPPGVDRDAVRRRMAEKYGIDTGVLYWPPVHRMPLYQPLGVNMPRTEGVLARRLCLPMHELVDPADCEEIVAALVDCAAVS